MTTIKPPASGPTGPQPQVDGATSSSAAAGPAEASFQQALREAGQVAAPTHAAPQSGPDPIAALAQDVQAGRVTMEQAVEQLLAQTLGSVGAHLSVAQRSELSSLLRDALGSDPTLLGLRADHG